MEIKTTADIHDIEMPECPEELMKEMNDKEIPADGTICRKCGWDSICNEKWIAVEDLIKLINKLWCQGNTQIEVFSNKKLGIIKEKLKTQNNEKL